MKHNTKEVESPRLAVEYYGADFPVDVLVKRMEEEDFIIPGFQREYVWTQEQGSQFIESLLIGLPTPTIFLAEDRLPNKYLVIDGQQRLKTLQYFYKGYLPNGKAFKLEGVAEQFKGMTYSELHITDRRSLDNSLIHCIIITEYEDPRGMFYVFERLNTTGTPLTSQEIRNAIYHGAFSELLQDLSKDQTWLNLYSKPHKNFVSSELILRFLALYFSLENHRENMADFLNQFMLKNKNLELISKEEIQKTFLGTIHFLENCIGAKVFYSRQSFRVGFYEVLMILVARKLKLEDNLDCEKFKKFYQVLVDDEKFRSLSMEGTASKAKLNKKLDYVEELYRNTYL